MKKEKLYLVKREVKATSLRQAMTKNGEVYEIQLAEEKYQPQDEKKVEGFKSRS